MKRKKLKKVPKSGTGTRLLSNFSERRLTFKPEIDIRGQRAEEAIPKIQEFIDEAIRRTSHSAGKGHDILKETIRNYLRTEPMVRLC